MKFFKTTLKVPLTNMSKKLAEKLKKKAYRDIYLEEQVRTWIARQIRVLREQRGWTQADLAKRCGKPQSTISRLEDPDYGKHTLKSLFELRSVFDVGLEVKFVSVSDAIERSRDLASNSMAVSPFENKELEPFVTSTVSRNMVVYQVGKASDIYKPAITTDDLNRFLSNARDIMPSGAWQPVVRRSQTSLVN